MVKIPEGWIETTLKQCVNTNEKSITKNYLYEKILYLDTGSITENKIEGLQEFLVNKAPSRAKRLVKDGDIIYSTVRPNQKHFGFIKNPQKNLVVSTGFAVLSPKENSDGTFIYYYITQDYITEKLHIIAEQAVSTYPSIKPENIENFPILLPPLPEQQAIASVLSAFDDKIELLRAENQTLEEMGQTLFKEWFISPLAPGRGNGTAKNSLDSKKEKSPLGDLGAELPDGWRWGKLGEVVEFIIDNRGKTPLTSDKGDYPMVEINAIIGDGMIINIFDCKKFVGEELYNTWFRKGHPKRGDVLFSTVGSIGEIAFVFDEIFCIAQNIVGLRSKYGKFMYLLLKSIQGNLKALDISSVQPSIKLPHLLDYDIVIPDEISIKEFEARVSPIFEKINNNGKQINTLISTRDQLLPKLMSGEVRVEF